ASSSLESVLILRPASSLVMLLFLEQQTTNFFQRGCICIIKTIVSVAVDVEYCDHFSGTVEDRGHDLAFACLVAGNVSRKLINIGHNQCFFFAPGCTADAFSPGDTGAGNRSLERPKHQLLISHKIKSHPEKRHGLL